MNGVKNNNKEVLPILPVKNMVLFPHVELPFAVGRPASLAAVDAASKEEDKYIVVMAQKDAGVVEPGEGDLYQVGTKATIRKMFRTERGVELILQGLERVKLENMEDQEGYLRGAFKVVPLPSDQSAAFDALHRTVLEQVNHIQDLAGAKEVAPLTHLVSQISDPLIQVFHLASVLGLDLEKEQSILEAQSRMEALHILHDFLTHETQVFEIQQKISSQVQSKLSKQQREYLLRQQLEAIRKELGEGESPQSAVALLREQMEKAKLPENVKKEAERELARLERMNESSGEYQMTRSYLELITELPWSESTSDNLDLERARTILDEDHFDLKDVKDRIIEHLAVMKLNPQAKAPVLCFVGPPGVGKTSLGESIARAMERKFERMSLGGLHDEAELRGHRRTYVGAMPGRIVQALRRAGSSNPVLMLDEIDKLGRDFRGDPSAAMMEILDPSQNFAFKDNYLDLPYDLSKVFFIMTANTLDTIPRPLLDRMEVLRLSGYTDQEKVQIARRYLLPDRIKQVGLKEDMLEVTDAALLAMVHGYTREAGLRELGRTIERAVRKIAVEVASGGSSERRKIDAQEVEELLGSPRHLPPTAQRQLDIGEAVGLAWTSTGGDTLFIEATLLPGGKGLTLTGQLGNVMKESAQAALSYIWARADSFGIPKDRFKQTGVHVHVPEGATPKDGPSAGVTMSTALVSVFTGLAARGDTAMTGEITLTGRVLPIGGVKEKLLAAHRADIRRVILPKQNERDLKEVPENVLNELEIVLADTLDDVFKAAIPDFEKRLTRSGPAAVPDGSPDEQDEPEKRRAP